MGIKDLLTIVVPCKDEEKGIYDFLTSIDSQNDIKGTKVIICDASNDNTIDIVLNSNLKNVDVFVAKGGLPSVARNNGFSFCGTPYVLFLDADMILKNKNTIKNCINKIYGKELLTIRTYTDFPYSIVMFIFYILQLIIKYKSPFALGGFQLWDSNAFKKYGMFDTNAKVAEDYKLSKLVNPSKFIILYSRIYTSPRRFHNKGVFYMIKLLIGFWKNKNNNEYFKTDHGYWK